jgi:hypothetical protein
MKLNIQTPKKALKAFLKQKPLRSEIDAFKLNLIALLDKINIIENRPKDESEEHLKNDLRDFLRDTYYKETNAINTKDKKDLVIHLGKTTDSEVGVIIEAKRPSNVGEMITATNGNKKALHELILYYLDERNKAENNQLKQLIITNVNEWYIIDANYFDKHIYRNTQIKKLYETKQNDKKDNPFFYEEIAKIISKIEAEIPCIYFNIQDYKIILYNDKKEDDKDLIALYKILSPQHLLKVATPNDSNSLNEKFYKELLYIIGLEEAKENGKNIIRRVKEKRNTASLIEATIEALHTEDVLHRLPDQTIYGETKDERIFNVSLELCITWINRILFLKLLEGQLVTYHQGNKEHRFLNTQTIHDFDELFKLFHKVLAINLKERSEAIKAKYSKVPYLNSSLFEISELEDHTIKINALDNSGQLELIGSTILKDQKKKLDKLPTLDYLFQFLDAYDFASEGTDDIQEDNKTIINASVLGKVFEKINGYKDGSIFTPAFITMYMCKQSIRLAVVQKFNDVKKWNVEKFEDLYNKIEDRKEANEIINTLKICDPAVGSGHFLVSALNEMIAIKSELGVLMDANGKTLRDYDIEIINDELIITDENTNFFAYNFKNKESNRIQKTLFHEKQTIIENCLFGVDINPNSVKICRLRLWIELLKNAYYKEDTNYTELETLPNIDINIKCGNSLLSRFGLDADLSKALKSIKYNVEAYRGFVNDYKNEKSRDVKRGLQKIIDSIKSDFRTEISKNDPKKMRLNKLSGELFTLLNQQQIFDLTTKEKKAQKEKKQKLETEVEKLATEIDEIKSNAIYKNAFEWRFEFPEVLNNKGEFEGFDLIIGNPPYISSKGDNFSKTEKLFYYETYETAKYQIDTYLLFIEKAQKILKSNMQFAFIIPNSWLNNLFLKDIRNYVFSNYYINQIVNTPIGVFQDITVDTIIILGEKSLKNNLTFDVLQANSESISFLSKKNQEDYFKNESYFINLFSDNTQNSIVEKIELGAKKLIEISQMSSGIKEYETGKGVPQQTKSDKENNRFNSKVKLDETYKKHIKGVDVENFSINWQGEFLSYGKWIAAPRDAKYFKGERFIIREIPYKTKLAVAYCNEEYTVKNSAHIGIISDKFFHIKYVIAILNSLLIGFYFKHKFAEYDTVFPKAKIGQCKDLPIKVISPKDQKPFTDIVDKIISAKQKKQSTTTLERQIDLLVYKLYNITPAEQKIIEGK